MAWWQGKQLHLIFMQFHFFFKLNMFAQKSSTLLLYCAHVTVFANKAQQIGHYLPLTRFTTNLDEVYSIILPVLATVELWRSKKLAIHVAECDLCWRHIIKSCSRDKKTSSSCCNVTSNTFETLLKGVTGYIATGTPWINNRRKKLLILFIKFHVVAVTGRRDWEKMWHKTERT